MKTLHEKAIEAYVKMLQIHINTKTQDTEFHKATEEFYETLFEVAHQTGEKYVDLGGKLSDASLGDQKQQAHDIIAELRSAIENHVENEDITLGTEDMLGSLANDLEDAQGTSRSFL